MFTADLAALREDSVALIHSAKVRMVAREKAGAFRIWQNAGRKVHIGTKMHLIQGVGWHFPRQDACPHLRAFAKLTARQKTGMR